MASYWALTQSNRILRVDYSGGVPFNTTEVTQQPAGTSLSNIFYVVTPDDIWTSYYWGIGGYPTLGHWDGSNWEYVVTADKPYSYTSWLFRDIYAISSTQIYAAVVRADAGDLTWVMKWDGSEWRTITTVTDDANVGNVHLYATGDDDIYLSVDWISRNIQHWNGSAWSPDPTPVGYGTPHVLCGNPNTGTIFIGTHDFLDTSNHWILRGGLGSWTPQDPPGNFYPNTFHPGAGTFRRCNVTPNGWIYFYASVGGYIDTGRIAWSKDDGTTWSTMDAYFGGGCWANGDDTLFRVWIYFNDSQLWNGSSWVSVPNAPVNESVIQLRGSSYD